MKSLRTTLSLIAFYILGLFAGAIICGALFLYVGISWLHQPQRSDNENVRQLLLWGRIYAEELNHLEDLQVKTQPEEPGLCSIVCNPSPLSSAVVAEDSAGSLTEYWEKQKKQAVQDPLFFLAMNKIEVLSQAYPRALRESILQDRSESKTARIFRAFLLEWDLTLHATHLALNWEGLKKKWDAIEAFQDGVQACRKREKSRQKVLEECQDTRL